VLENCTPGSVRGAPGNRRPYLAIIEEWRPSVAFRMILSRHDSVCFVPLLCRESSQAASKWKDCGAKNAKNGTLGSDHLYPAGIRARLPERRRLFVFSVVKLFPSR
jgi:hypothetical protein